MVICIFTNTKKRLNCKNGQCNNGNPDLLNHFPPGVQTKMKEKHLVYSFFLTIFHPPRNHAELLTWGTYYLYNKQIH